MRHGKFAFIALALLVVALTPKASQAVTSFFVGESSVGLEGFSLPTKLDENFSVTDGFVIPFDSDTLWQLVFTGVITNNSTSAETISFTFSSDDFAPKPPGTYPNVLQVIGFFSDPDSTGDATGDAIDPASADAADNVVLGPLAVVGDQLNNSFDLFTIVSGSCGFGDVINGNGESLCHPFLSATVTLTLAAGHSAHFPIIVAGGPDAAAVPEPSTLLLLTSGLVGVVAFGKRPLRKGS